MRTTDELRTLRMLHAADSLRRLTPMKVALTLMPDSRSCIPAAVRAQLFALDVCQPSPSRKGVPPLGLATLTAYLRENGGDVSALDFRTDVTGTGSDQIRHLSEETRWVC